jgi:hypothetical protein
MSAEIDITNYFDTVRDFVEDIESRRTITDVTDGNARLAAHFDEELRKWFREHEDVNPGGNSGEGIDLPRMNTRIKAPKTLQSSLQHQVREKKFLG